MDFIIIIIILIEFIINQSNYFRIIKYSKVNCNMNNIRLIRQTDRQINKLNLAPLKLKSVAYGVVYNNKIKIKLN